MECLYVPTLERDSRELLIEGDELHHVRVLRCREGDTLYASNGRGLRAQISLRQIESRFARAAVEAIEFAPGELPYRLTLAVGMLAARDRFEWLVEKSTELGVARIVPLLLDRSEKIHSFRHERLLAKAVAALKQSRRSVLPVIEMPQRLEDFLATSAALLIVCAPDGQGPSLEPGDLAIVIGSEGGFSPREEQILASFGARKWSLGSLRLRSETAALVATSVVRVAWSAYI
ncbi:MAG: ribosomal RNA small subunit methyltransferase E [Candidatus Kapaibacterium sp.]|nr:MAG: ribosomal RNA small subunit methyltransferase E [Candidatus Kapabacteria bacterium]